MECRPEEYINTMQKMNKKKRKLIISMRDRFYSKDKILMQRFPISLNIIGIEKFKYREPLMFESLRENFGIKDASSVYLHY